MNPSADDDASTIYLIWSHEHGAWWRDGGHGYTRSLTEAGRTDRTHALLICEREIPGTASQIGALPELPVRLDDALMLRDHYRRMYPHVPPEAWE